MIKVPAELINKAAKGDMDAFEQIYRSTCGYVLSVAYRISSDMELAREITQDTFLKIHKNLNSFGFRASFSTWLYRITVNSALNSVKKRKKTLKIIKPHENENVMLNAESGFENPRDSLGKKDNKELLGRLLQKINPDQRACIVLREIAGLGYSDISKILKVNINTVRTRLMRARHALVRLAETGDRRNEL